MIQVGLHIGLSSWINRQHGADRFPLFPRRPVEIRLADLESVLNIRVMRDVANQFQFSQYVNFIPRLGQNAEIQNPAEVLWQVHRNILRQMDFAAKPLTENERQEFQAAQDILYSTDTSGSPMPSQKYLLYLELQKVYQDLIQSGGSPEEIREAMANWIVQGYKQLIEDALEVIVRLGTRSSREQAEMERLSLSEAPPGPALKYYSEMQYAPVYFSPVSAVERETWMSAKVSFTDLDQAVESSPQSGEWSTYRANRRGEILFDYVVLSCLRPWFTPALYRADDWRLGSSGLLASRGNGVDGILPGYVDTVYLACVRSVKIWTRRFPRKSVSGVSARPVSLSLQQVPGVSRSGSKGRIAKVGVVRQRNNLVHAVTASGKGRRGTETRQVADVVLPAMAGGGYRPLHSGLIKRLSATDTKRRYVLALSILENKDQEKPDAGENFGPEKVYLVGFGCKKIPFAPNPNPHYQWI